jgi:hypothetical protein
VLTQVILGGVDSHSVDARTALVCFERASTLFRDSLDRTPPPLVVPPRPDFRVLASPSTVRHPRPRRPGLHPDPPPPGTGTIARPDFSAAFRS